MDRAKDFIPPRTPHEWEDWGNNWGSTYVCRRCRVNQMDTRTEFCEDVPVEKWEREQEAARKEKLKAEALEICRAHLTKEQWELLGLNKLEPYRDIDVLNV